MFKRHPHCKAVRQSETYKRHASMVIIGIVIFFIGIIGALLNHERSNTYALFIFILAGATLSVIYFIPLYQMTKNCELGCMYDATYHDVNIKLSQRSFRISVQYINLEGETQIIESYEYFGWMDIESYRYKRYKILVVPNQPYATIIEIIQD
ncbi:MAG: hypothetical protein C4537_06020 [Acholeplasma sp.]|jgi:hypothetical protein|nr:MAG: hypothetical protein C4537_06020 [Acholeplasma sp.]